MTTSEKFNTVCAFRHYFYVVIQNELMKQQYFLGILLFVTQKFSETKANCCQKVAKKFQLLTIIMESINRLLNLLQLLKVFHIELETLRRKTCFSHVGKLKFLQKKTFHSSKNLTVSKNFLTC